MTAIGPGSVVQCIRAPNWGRALTIGALYRVEAVQQYEGHCASCGKWKPPVKVSADSGDWCPCAFAPWPPEPPAELRCEPVEHDEPVFG